jgi:hypothetical protein
MTTRRDLLLMAAGTALLTACRDTRPPGVAVPDMVLADSDAGLLILGPDHRVEKPTANAVVSFDGALVYAASPTVTGGTALLSIHPQTLARTERGAVDGRWFPRVVSNDGLSCALTDVPPDPSAPVPAPRAATALLIVQNGVERRLDLPGVVEPDAFTNDGTALFVLEWLPAGGPDRYRVRLLDLKSGELHPLLTRAKTPVPPGAEEEMRGAGRHAVLSPDRQILYTLYTHQADHRHTRDLIAGRPGGVHAFVHVLHLVERWAYCLDLPHPFGEGPAAAHAIAVSPAGDRLVVADVSTGTLAHADTAALRVLRVSRLPAGSGSAGSGPVASGPAGIGSAGMVATSGGRVFVGAGRTVTAVDGADAVTRTWAVPDVIRGVGVSRDGRRLYVGGTDEILWFDTGTGERLGKAPAGGLAGLRHVA